MTCHSKLKNKLKKRRYSMKIRNNRLVLNKHDLKVILMHIGLCAECVSYDNGKVEEMDFIKLFEEKLESDKWLNELENAKYERLEIELN
jgi:hypothetical protein